MKKTPLKSLSLVVLLALIITTNGCGFPGNVEGTVANFSDTFKPQKDNKSKTAQDGEAKTTDCQLPKKAIFVTFSRAKYPHIISHIEKSWKLGYPKVMEINRVGADYRRDQLLQGIPTKPGYDRDEAVAAVLRNEVKAHVRYVESSENRSAGASLGAQISDYCDGTKVKYRFIP